MLKKIRSKIVHSKLFIQRSMSYVSIINSAMILFLLLSNLEKYGINIRIERWFFPIILIGFILLITFGYIEDRLGFHSEESRAATNRNPQMTEIMNRLDRIEKKLDKYEKNE